MSESWQSCLRNNRKNVSTQVEIYILPRFLKYFFFIQFLLYINSSVADDTDVVQQMVNITNIFLHQ